MAEFERKVQEVSRVVEASETLKAEVNGWDVIVSKEGRGSWRVSMCRIHDAGGPSMRMPLLSFHPRNVDNLELLAEQLPAVLRETAAALRGAGIEDMRSESDRTWDEMDAAREQLVARLVAGPEPADVAAGVEQP